MAGKEDKPKVKRRHKIIGLRVKKKFDGVTYYGRITAIDTEMTDNEEKGRKLYHIVYDDGDEEDVYTPEIKRIVIFPKVQKRTSVKGSETDTHTKQKPSSNQSSNAIGKREPSSAESKGSGINLKKEEKKRIKPASIAVPKKTTTVDISKESIDANEEKIIEEVKEMFNSPPRKKNTKAAPTEGCSITTSSKKLAKNKKVINQERKSSKITSKVGASSKLRGSGNTGKAHQAAEKKRSRRAEDYGRSRKGAKRKKTKVDDDAPSIFPFFCHICHDTTAPLWKCPKSNQHFFCSRCMCDLNDFEQFVSRGCVFCRDPSLCDAMLLALAKDEKQRDAPKNCWIHKVCDDGHTEIKKWALDQPLPAGFSKGRGYGWIRGTVNGTTVRQLWSNAKPLPDGFVFSQQREASPSGVTSTDSPESE